LNAPATLEVRGIPAYFMIKQAEYTGPFYMSYVLYFIVMKMNESELYKELGILTKDRSIWEESIPYVSSLLDNDSVKILAKALWLLGEMGLIHPQSVQDAVPEIASFCDSPEPLLRERAVNAIKSIKGAVIRKAVNIK
jgi:hypothetical protein